jgi:hypothetical protein
MEIICTYLALCYSPVKPCVTYGVIDRWHKHKIVDDGNEAFMQLLYLSIYHDVM